MSPQGVEHMRTAARTARPGFATAVLTATLLVLTGRAAEPAAANATQPEGATPLLLHELKTCPHKIVFETCRGGNWEIYIMNADGSNVRALMFDRWEDNDPEFTRNGDILFT